MKTFAKVPILFICLSIFLAGTYSASSEAKQKHELKQKQELTCTDYYRLRLVDGSLNGIPRAMFKSSSLMLSGVGIGAVAIIIPVALGAASTVVVAPPVAGALLATVLPVSGIIMYRAHDEMQTFRATLEAYYLKQHPYSSEPRLSLEDEKLYKKNRYRVLSFDKAPDWFKELYLKYQDQKQQDAFNKLFEKFNKEMPDSRISHEEFAEILIKLDKGYGICDKSDIRKKKKHFHLDRHTEVIKKIISSLE